jgi:hypothetical protein
LPAGFSSRSKPTPDQCLIAAAIEDHASNASETLLDGLEALGHLMSVAGANGDRELSSHHLMMLGGLVAHIAVEAQYLQETQWEMRVAKEQGEAA